MGILKNNGLCALFLGLCMLGLTFNVQAGEIDPPKKEKTTTTVVVKKNAGAIKNLVTQTHWYTVSKIDDEGDNELSNYVIGSKLDTPPASSANPNQCDQQNSSGRFCAIQLEFPTSHDPEDPENMNAETAITNLSATLEGSARNASQP